MQTPDIDSDLFVEVLGILVNLDIPSYNWGSLIASHELLTVIAGQCVPAPSSCHASGVITRPSHTPNLKQDGRATAIVPCVSMTTTHPYIHGKFYASKVT